MRIYKTKAEEIRQVLKDPLHHNQSVTSIARFLGVHYRTVHQQYQRLLKAGEIPRKTRPAEHVVGMRRQRLEPEIETVLLSPEGRTRSLADIGRQFDLPENSIRAVYRRLLKEGKVPQRRTGGCGPGVNTKDLGQRRRLHAPAPRRQPWPRSSST